MVYFPPPACLAASHTGGGGTVFHRIKRGPLRPYQACLHTESFSVPHIPTHVQPRVGHWLPGHTQHPYADYRRARDGETGVQLVMRLGRWESRCKGGSGEGTQNGRRPGASAWPLGLSLHWLAIHVGVHRESPCFSRTHLHGESPVTVDKIVG